MIKRILCFLAFHRFSITEDIPGIELAVCLECKRKWARDTERQQVYELKRQA